MYNIIAAGLTTVELSAIILHCFERETDLMTDQRGLTDDEVEDRYEYLQNIQTACKEELDERIKQIFKP